MASRATLLGRTILILAALPACSRSRPEPTFTPPSGERLAALMEFSGPVSLAMRVVPPEQLRRKPERGIARVAWSYSDPAHTSQTISIAVYPAGEYRKDIRAEFMKWHRQHSGMAETADGRPVLQFLLGMGPGGFADGALLRCRDARFEMVMTVLTDFHDDEANHLYAHHMAPRKGSHEVIERVETLAFNGAP